MSKAITKSKLQSVVADVAAGVIREAAVAAFGRHAPPLRRPGRDRDETGTADGTTGR